MWKGLLACIGLLGLGIILIIPLEWKQQGILGTLLILGALVLNGFRSRAITMWLIAISSFSTLRYAYWRVTQSWEGITSSGHLHRWDTAFVLLLLLAELYAFATLFLGYFQTLRPLRRRPVPMPGDRRRWPTVDVFIPTYNEPLSVVRTTVLASIAMDYPQEKMRIFILDDGRREEFRVFADQTGVGYIARTNNFHAKAGNINHALAQTGGDYVAIFDSDHVPTSSFLQATLGGFLQDRQLGIVQTPHHFYSPDPFERNLRLFRKIPNEGELFHRLVQDGNDLWNASFFCGSCAVLRRDALNEIGGIAVETVTEDAHTALRMQRCGWNTAYINVPQAAGLATETLAAHIGQRIRWARGMIQILRLENPLFAGGLTVSQRLCYFNATTHFLFALPRLIFLTIPLVYLLLGMVNIYGYSLAVFSYALPHIVLSNLASSRIQGRHRFSFWNEIYEAVLAPYILLPTLLALISPRLGKFNVTVKGGLVRRSYFDRRIALPLLFLLALNVAGLYKARQRYLNEPAHRDTIVMNSAWAIYNIVILSVAASVAWERRQRRSEVRVDVRVPLTLVDASGRRATGAASQLSCRGASASLDRALRLSRGAAVSLVFGDEDSRFEIPAFVAQCSGRRQHLVFSSLTLGLELQLVRVIYSRPDAWVFWNESRPADNALRSLLHIVWLAARAVFIVSLGLMGLLPTRDRPDPKGARSKERKPALAASILLALMGLTPTTLEAFQGTHGNQPASGPQSLVFSEEYELGSPRQNITLRGAGASQNFYFSVPVTKVISSATLKLHYAAPALQANQARLELTLNGSSAGQVILAPGVDLETSVSLPTDLLTGDNTLSLKLAGGCADCSPQHPAWITVSATSRLSLTGTKLQLPNDLALLPLPFFDPAGQRPWTLPVVFSERPDGNALKAAAIAASWFGVLSDIRGVHFPVKIGELPDGNAIVFVRRGSQLATNLSLPSNTGGLLAIRDNPRDPYGKLLILAGDNTKDLLAAARVLVTRNHYQAHIDVAFAGDVSMPTRQRYDAPRWLKTNQPAPIGTYTTAKRLELRGPGRIDIYFRLPPDLFLRARQSVPLLLKYAYDGVAPGSGAALHVRLNDKDAASILLEPTSSRVEKSDIVRLPTGRLQPYTNTLTVDFDFGRDAGRDNPQQYAAIRRDSWLDLRSIPHSVVLPKLELFADAGFPYTEWPDLGRTAVILPATPDVADYEALLDMVAFFGAQTGCPGTALTIGHPVDVQTVADKDLVLLGTATSQPLLSQWASSMPLAFSEDRVWLNESQLAGQLLNPEWVLREEDRNRLAVLASKRSIDGIVEAFVSPLHADRSVVAIVPSDPGRPGGLASLFTPAVRQGPIYGGVTVSQNGRFQSFLVGVQAYQSGELDPYQQTRVFLIENYWLIPLIVAVLAVFVSAWLRQKTERVAAKRLASEAFDKVLI